MRGAEACRLPSFDGALLHGLDRYSIEKQWNSKTFKPLWPLGGDPAKELISLQFSSVYAAFKQH